MKKIFKSSLLALGFAGALGGIAYGAGFITNNLPAATTVTGLEQSPADTNLPSGINPASEAVNLALLIQGAYTTASNATSFTATAAQTSGAGKITFTLTGAPATAQNVTTPTAAALIANLPTGSAVGYTWLLKVVNQGGTSSGVWTIVGGTSVTITGNATVAVAGSRQLQCKWATATTVTCTDIGN